MNVTIKKVCSYILTCIIGGLVICFVFSGIIFPVNFTDDPILDEFRRVPLQYPYEIADLNNAGCANLQIWEKDYIVQGGIVAYSWTTNIVFGETIFPSEDKTYFIFCMTNNSLRTFISKEVFTNACAVLGADYKAVQPVEKQWENHWKPPR
jgi:hypothetical protein